MALEFPKFSPLDILITLILLYNLEMICAAVFELFCPRTQADPPRGHISKIKSQTMLLLLSKLAAAGS